MKTPRKLIQYFFRRREFIWLSWCLLLLSIPSYSISQWRLVHVFDDIIGSIYFVDDIDFPKVGFVGSWFNEFSPGKLWRTVDSGRSWSLVSSDSWLNPVDQVVFKDSYTGWTVVGSPTSTIGQGGGCYKTTDAGKTWQQLPFTLNLICKAIYYHKPNGKLFLSTWEGPTYSSQDEGMTWSLLVGPKYSTGFTFLDDNRGFVGSAETSPKNAITTDGGISWQVVNLDAEVWQPLGIKNSNILFCFSEVTRSLWKSYDFGFSWMNSPQFISNVGTITGDITALYTQYQYGVLKSTDQGNSWFSICGPNNSLKDIRFYQKDNYLYASEFNTLYLNTSGRGYGPRLQIFNGSYTLTVGDIKHIDISYSNESYYESVDSICFTMNLKGEAIGFESDSVTDGWRVKRREVTDSTIHYCLERTTTDTIAFNSFMLRLYMKAYLTRDRTAQLTLDEVNFNQDVTFRDCMLPTLKATDTVSFVVNEECGDSTLRAFLNSKPVLELLSIFPNPTSGDVTVSYSTLLDQDINLQVSDFIGKVQIEETLSPQIGINNYTIPIPSNWGGSYYIRLQMGKDVVTGKFVKQ